MDKKEELKENYNSITTLEGLSAIRKRPGMYVGSPQSLDGKNPNALIQLAQEALSNAIDEAYAGFGNRIDMIINEDNSITIRDQGRGMPKGKNFDDAIRALTVLHSSGKFDSSSYASSIGQNGVGIKACSALSKWLQIEAVTTNKEHYFIKVQQDTVLEKKNLPYKKDMHTGTIISFLPDDTIFDTINWDDQTLINKIEQSSFLTPKVHFNFIDKRKKGENGEDYFIKSWYSENGMPDYVEYISKSETLINGLKKPISFKGTYETNDKYNDEISVEGALSYTEGSGETILSFANGAPTIDGGPHVEGAKLAIYKAFTDYGKDKKLFKRGKSINASDTRDGLILSLLVKIPEKILMFESQSKTKLATVAAKDAVKDIVYTQVTNWLYDHNKLATKIVNNMIDSSDAREAAIKAKKAAREARKTKKAGGKLIVSSKLSPASSKDPKLKSLFISEGDSACLVGNTKIRLANGETDTIKNIVKRFNNGEKLYVYSNADNEESINEGKGRSWEDKNDKGLRINKIIGAKLTRKDADLVRVYIDNNTYVDCTPDHKFLLSNGKYKRADELENNDSLSVMPFIDRGGYLGYKGASVHRLAAHQFYPNKEMFNQYVHHKDHNRHNNTPDNIVILTPEEHMKLTAKERNEAGDSFGARTSFLYHHNKEYYLRQKEIQALGGRSGKGHKHNQAWDKKQRENTSRTTSEGMAKMSKEAKKRMRHNQIVTLTLVTFKTILENEPNITLDEIKVLHKEKVFKFHRTMTKLQYLKKKYNCYRNANTYDYIKNDFKDDKELLEAIKNANHKVVKVKKLDYKKDVYDIEVEGTHNFCLDNDVFVHNCATLSLIRDKRYQATFPIRGKILNVIDAKLSRVLKNEEISTIASVLGAGIGPAFNEKDLDYNKVLITSDADDDGAHIANLLTTLFYKFFPGLIENGHLYRVISPLYHIGLKNKDGKEKEELAYDESEYEDLMNRVRKDEEQGYKVQFQNRYKGLGSLSKEATKKFIADPATRKLQQITIDDAEAAKEALQLWMGDNSDERRDRIMNEIDFDDVKID